MKINKKQIPRQRTHRQFLIFALPIAIVLGSLFAYYMALRVDRNMRAYFLQQTTLLAPAFNIEQIKALAGNDTDLEKPEYQHLKKQLMAARKANPQCRFLYIMGRKPDQTVFYFADSEPPNSTDYSPPGQVYEDSFESIRSIHNVFNKGVGVIEGPSTDNWGEWVSGIVPLLDPSTGKTAAVLGMDIDATKWKSDIVAKSTSPIGIVMFMLVGIAYYFYSAQGSRTSPKPVLQHLLPPLTVMVLSIIIISVALIWQQYQLRVADSIKSRLSQFNVQFQTALDQQVFGLSVALQPISVDAKVKKALQERNTDELRSTWGPVFKTLSRENNVTHFYFLDANRFCLLRLHNTEKYGDKIDRVTAIRAEQTGKIASGIELGNMGEFTLRVIQPVFFDETLIGYVELGIGIEQILQNLHNQSGDQLAVFIRKKYLDQQSWEDGMKILQREANWNLITKSVVTYTSYGPFPEPFAQWANNSTFDTFHKETSRKAKYDGKDWYLTLIPLNDVTGKNVGDLLFAHDISALAIESDRLLTLAIASSTTIFLILLTFVYGILRRTDDGIRIQQAELQHSKELFSETLRSIGDGVIATDVTGNITFLNAVAETLTGWTMEEASGHSISEVFCIVHAGTKQAVEIPIFSSMRENKIIELANHTTLIARNGSKCQIADSCAPIHNNLGQVIGSVLVFRDVSREHQQQEQLRESNSRFDQLAEQSRTCTWEVNVDGIFTYVSHVAETLTGYSPDEIIGKMHFFDFFPESTRQELRNSTFAVFDKREEIKHIEHLIQGKNGKLLWVSIYGLPIINSEGIFLGYRGSDTDITERKFAEDALRESEARLRGIAQSAQDAIIMIKPEGIISYWNPAAEKILGYKDEEAIGKNLHELITPKRYLKAHRMAFSMFINTGKGDAIGKTVELAARRKDGTEIAVSLSLSAVLLHTKWHAVGILRDITDNKRAEQALLAAKEQAEQLNKHLEQQTHYATEMAKQAELANMAKSEFLANMSHEIRTPMNGVMGMLQLLDDTELSEEQQDYLDTIKSSGQLLLKIINDILDLSKIEAGKVELTPVPFNIFNLVKDLERLFYSKLIEKNVELVVDVSPEIPNLLIGDSLYIKQVLVNLMGNAIKFTPPFGATVLQIVIKSLNQNCIRIGFMVSDTGVGIPENRQNEIFKAFIQSDSSVTRQFGGTGLGLTISYKLVQLLGGKLKVRSKRSQGSVFYFDCPFEISQQQTDCNLPAHDDSLQYRQQPLHILVAEDNLVNQKLITKLLEKVGHTVTLSSDGKSEVDLFIQNNFDLILMDIQMPILDGIEATKEIRLIENNGIRTRTPIIALTAHALQGDREKYISLDMDDYIAKPIDKKNLFQTIATVMANITQPV